MNTHGIPAQPQQLADGKELKAIILPLEKYAKNPLIYIDLCGSGKAAKDGDGNWRLWFPGKDEQLELDRFTLKAYPKGCNDGIVIPFKEGDRIYLQEEWGRVFGSDGLGTANTAYYDTVKDIQYARDLFPAHIMPVEAAQHWFDVTGVRVCQINDLELVDIANAGLNDAFLQKGATGDAIWESVEIAAGRWNAVYPEYPWDIDRWVVVLSVEAVDQ
jgi:hypothetical protein